MESENGRRDIEWLRRVVRKHFKSSWQRVVATLKVKHGK